MATTTNSIGSAKAMKEKQIEIPAEEPIITIKDLSTEKFDDSNKLKKKIVIPEPKKIVPKRIEVAPQVIKSEIITEVQKVVTDPIEDDIRLKLKQLSSACNNIYRVEMNILTGKEVRYALKKGFMSQINDYKYKIIEEPK